jgi:hypothetical protein
VHRGNYWRSSLTVAESSKATRSVKDMYLNFPATLTEGGIHGQWKIWN